MSRDLEAIRAVLDKLYAPVCGPVEFADVAFRRLHDLEYPALTSDEVAAARRALRKLGEAVEGSGRD